MGLSQTGSATGEINVLAGGAVGVNSGNGWRSQAQIGHGIGGGQNDPDPRMGVGSLADTGQTPDGKFGGGQHHQFRAFANNADLDDNTFRTGTLAGHMISSTTLGSNYTGSGTLYGGGTSVTGVGDDIDSTLTGDITVTSETGAVTVRAFDGRTVGGEDLQYTFAQIGHAGMTNGMQRVISDGIITVQGTDILFQAGNDSDGYAYAQLGHGGALSDGDHKGNIFATATTGKIEFLGGIDTIWESDSVANYAQLGHGGYDADGSHSGNIMLNVGSNAGIGVNFVAGNTDRASVQLGHGG